MDQNQAEQDVSNKNNTINVAAPQPGKQWKLRQTCDLCSEAKVKCDKKQPRCGRCERLSYECVYSPARRIGRPRPRSPRSQDAGRPASNGNATTADDIKKDHTVRRPSARPASSSITSAARQANFNVDMPMTDVFPDDIANQQNTRASVSTGANSITSADLSASNNASQCVSIQDNFLSIAEQPSLGAMQEVVRHNPYEYDCATVAVATLQKLAETGLDSKSANSTATPVTATAAADVLADQIPFACRQAVRILVCPCSVDMDMALLTASLAAAILEVADAALHTLKPPGTVLHDDQRTLLALGTLPTISQVVTLFTHRYSATQANRPPEALLLLAASLRTTLKAMAEEATNRYLDGGMASSHTNVKMPASGCV
jgi:hypothetical protein